MQKEEPRVPKLRLQLAMKMMGTTNAVDLTRTYHGSGYEIRLHLFRWFSDTAGSIRKATLVLSQIRVVRIDLATAYAHWFSVGSFEETGVSDPIAFDSTTEN